MRVKNSRETNKSLLMMMSSSKKKSDNVVLSNKPTICKNFKGSDNIIIPRKPRARVGDIKVSRAPKKAVVLDSYGYRRKMFNLMRDLESMVLHTNIQNLTKQELVDQVETAKTQVTSYLKSVISLLTKLCEFDVDYARNERLTLIKIYENAREARVESLVLENRQDGEIDPSPSTSNNISLFDTMRFQHERLSNVENNLLDIMMCHDFNDD